MNLSIKNRQEYNRRKKKERKELNDLKNNKNKSNLNTNSKINNQI